ncbi:MAG: DoxX-like family protein [Leptospira sp.]|nr:DoxX-like family protein [Leptospira sp.]
MNLNLEIGNLPWDFYPFFLLFFVAGVCHFLTPKFFLRIIPPQIPYPKLANWGSGLIEIFLSILLVFTETRSFAAWGIFLLLLAVWPANIYHYTIHNKKFDPPKWILLLRIPLQIPLLLWAYRFT